MDLLECLFPHTAPSIFRDLLESQGKSVEECINIILVDEEEEGHEGDRDVALLVSMFPNLTFEAVYEKYVDADFNVEVATELLLKGGDENCANTKIRLPKIPNSSRNPFRWTATAIKCAMQLSETFPQFEEESVKDVFQKNGGDVALAAKELADIACRDDDVKKREDEQLSTLAIMFESSLDISELRKIVQKCTSIEEKIELAMSMIAEKENAWEKPLKSSSSSKEKELLQFCSKESTITAAPTTSNDRVMKVSQDDPRTLREKASALALQRNEFFERAAASFKRGQLTGLSSASFYAEQGRAVDVQVKAANHTAYLAQLDYNRRQHNCDDSVLDLHGLTLKESIQALREKMDAWNSKRPLRIITGAGNNSKGGKGKLMASSQTYVLRQGWKIDKDNIGNGFFNASRPTLK